MIALVCPGQGSQTPGFLTAWLEFPEFRESIEQMSEASGIDLIAHGTVSDAETIRDTSIAQPLIVAASVASAFLLSARAGQSFEKITGVAGHSVGEVSAAVVAGIFDAPTGIRFVRERGNAMALAAALEATSMAAVVGGDSTEVLQSIDDAGLYPANFNGSGQIVAAGSAEKIGELVANPPSGSRVIALSVAGAFHTRYMQPAVATLADYANSVTVADPSLRLWSNREGSAISNGRDFVDRLVSQVSSPVRWDLCMESMSNQGITKIIELVPGGTLSGLAKRGMPGVETIALKTPENLEVALAALQNAHI
jgi:[acyl-carrier-protein] S-malonyltransferase